MMEEVRGRTYGVRVRNFVKIKKAKKRWKKKRKGEGEATIVDNVVHRLSV